MSPKSKAHCLVSSSHGRRPSQASGSFIVTAGLNVPQSQSLAQIILNRHPTSTHCLPSPFPIGRAGSLPHPYLEAGLRPLLLRYFRVRGGGHLWPDQTIWLIPTACLMQTWILKKQAIVSYYLARQLPTIRTALRFNHTLRRRKAQGQSRPSLGTRRISTIRVSITIMGPPHQASTHRIQRAMTTP